MKFGIYSSIAAPPRGEHIERAIDEVIAEAQLAESVGFDSCFFGEHHQDRDGFLPSPLIVATAVAARTRTLRVGTSVILLPLYHPIRVAEDAITLDLVAKGRVVLGVGIGYQPADFQAFGVPMEERVARFEESVAILRLAWAGEPFSFKGAHYAFDSVRVTPRPFQAGGPPLWIGANVPPAARRAGRLADAFVGTPSTGLATATRLIEIYRHAAGEAGRTPRVVLMRDAWVAPTHAEAEAVYGPHVMTAYRYYWENRIAEFRSLPADTPFTLETLATDRVILGEPETVVREFQRWQRVTGAEYCLLRLRHAHSGGPPHEEIMKAIRLFGERVLPHC
ncbi:MAG: LLM class flavin-dependent oxidoreductase [Candidatus Rokubacteria bacterium]|nr:LLM class flavin-dependent oxidoreductase [Candidatus Rokubacteria bacterium]